MSNRLLSIIVVGLLVLVGVSSTLYIVKETERGVALRFGKLVETDIKPGLHVKWPFADEIRKFDARVLTLDAPAERFLTVEKKGMIVDSYAKWRIKDVGTYYKATNGEEREAVRIINQRINEGLRNQFAQRSLQEVVSGERDELMLALVDTLNEVANTVLGVEVVDVRVKRIELPEQVSDSVFNRMKTERAREAREHRSKGNEQAEVIRADADRQQAVIKADAYKESEIIRGEGDAMAASIYAKAYNQDPEFYSFMRSLNAYKQAFNNKGDLMVIDPESDFFRFMKNLDGKK